MIANDMPAQPVMLRLKCAFTPDPPFGSYHAVYAPDVPFDYKGMEVCEVILESSIHPVLGGAYFVWFTNPHLPNGKQFVCVLKGEDEIDDHFADRFEALMVEAGLPCRMEKPTAA